jgi:catechol 2,3-dioxygenase-like lactoylglutathione lyase family enzyme
MAFYVEVLGFEIQYQRVEEGFAMLERQGARIMLDQNKTNSTTGRTWLAAPLEAPCGRGVNLQIETTEIDALYDKVKLSEMPIYLPIEEKWYRSNEVLLGNRQFIVLDPDGYMLRFFQDIGERCR